MVRVKVCCIASEAEAARAIDAGATALGLVSSMPSGPGVISEERIAEIVATVPPSVETFLLTSRTTADEIAEQHTRCRTSTLQLVDAVALGAHAALRSMCPGTRLVQVIHVIDEQQIDEARSLAPDVDALLLDSGRPDAAVKELGGTGRTHDWSLSRRIVEAVDVPVYLAGGLRPHNVAEAVAAARPYGVDVCSGVRTDGGLDARKVQAFVAAATT